VGYGMGSEGVGHGRGSQGMGYLAGRRGNRHCALHTHCSLLTNAATQQALRARPLVLQLPSSTHILPTTSSIKAGDT
jgi:hypothetical protein